MAFVEMMAPAITGTLFNNERRQSPLLVELYVFVMRALLETSEVSREQPFARLESSGYAVCNTLRVSSYFE